MRVYQETLPQRKIGKNMEGTHRLREEVRKNNMNNKGFIKTRI